jgi:ATP-dependent DNA helicase RecQ
MVKYCTTTDCLRQYILKYFGEKSGDMCAKCSNCAASFETEDVTLAAQKILSCVYRLAQRRLNMSATAVAEILSGSKNQRIKKFKLEELSTYGIMADTPRLKIRAVIEGLCDRGYMRKGEYEALILTNKAKGILFDGETLSMAFKKSTVESAPKAAHMQSDGGRIDESPELFSRLRKLRSQLAEEESVPAYIIFSDASLHDMCQKLPKTREEFLYVSGVGKKKSERYGDSFTEAIRTWIEESGEVGETSELVLSRRRKSQSVDRSDGGGGGKPSSAPKQLGEIAGKIASERGLNSETVEYAIRGYLLLNGYLEQRADGIFVTPKGGVNGIAMSTKCADGGERNTVIEYRRNAQKLIDDALDDIL